MAPDQTLAEVAARMKPVPAHFATLFRAIRPDASFDEFNIFLDAQLPGGSGKIDKAERGRVFWGHGPERLSLADQGYVSGIHPVQNS